MAAKNSPRKLKLSLPIQKQPEATPHHNLPDSQATMTVGSLTFVCDTDDLEVLEELGSGAFGVVEKMKHKPTGSIMAVKRIRANVTNKEQKKLLMDLDVSTRSAKCEYAVHCYGAMFREGDVWLCMEVMDCCLDDLYKRVYQAKETIPENIIATIASCIIKALRYLHRDLKVIHRDVKPSNMLLSKKGDVKICDYGISGHLVNSLAKTVDAGCRPYMAPERVNPPAGCKGFDIRSDVWSLGICMIEISTGVFPYKRWETPFEQLKQVVMEPAPTLPQDRFTDEFVEFVHSCLQKDVTKRPNYETLLEYSFITSNSCDKKEMSKFVSRVIEELPPLNTLVKDKTRSSVKKR